MTRTSLVYCLVLLTVSVSVYATGQEEQSAHSLPDAADPRAGTPQDAVSATQTATNSATGVLADFGGRTIAAGAVNDTAPFSTVDVFTGEAVGFEYDLTTEIARRLNLRITWRFLSRNSLTDAIAEHRLDFGMGAVALTAETIAAAAGETLQASNPYLFRRQKVLLRAEGRVFDSVAQLAADAGTVFGVAGGTPAFYVAAYDLLHGADERRRVTLYSSAAHAVEGLRAGEVDAVVVDGAAVGSLLEGTGNSLVVMEESLAAEAYVLVFPNGSDLLGPFNAAIATMQADGFIDEREAYWFYEREELAGR